MKTIALKPGDIVAYKEEDNDRTGTVISNKSRTLVVKLKYSKIDIQFDSSEVTLEQLGLRLVATHSEALWIVESHIKEVTA